MSVQVLDCTFAPNDAALRTAGYVGRIRYVGRFSKAALKPEIDAARNAGEVLGFVWESTATRALEGTKAGQADAVAACQAMDALGVPRSIPIIWACDTDASGQATVAYGQAFHAAANRPVGVYGSAQVIDANIAAGTVVEGWQTNAAGWDYPRRVSPHASIHQHLPAHIAGIGYVDPDTVDNGSHLVWWPVGDPNAPVDSNTWRAPSWPGHAIRPGDVSQDVAVVAVMLKVLGYHGFNLTGSAAKVYGVGKQNAIGRFQKNHGLVRDRIVGEKTWTELAKRLTEVHNAPPK